MRAAREKKRIVDDSSRTAGTSPRPSSPLASRLASRSRDDARRGPRRVRPFSPLVSPRAAVRPLPSPRVSAHRAGALHLRLGAAASVLRRFSSRPPRASPLILGDGARDHFELATPRFPATVPRAPRRVRTLHPRGEPDEESVPDQGDAPLLRVLTCSYTSATRRRSAASGDEPVRPERHASAVSCGGSARSVPPHARIDRPGTRGDGSRAATRSATSVARGERRTGRRRRAARRRSKLAHGPGDELADGATDAAALGQMAVGSTSTRAGVPSNAPTAVWSARVSGAQDDLGHRANVVADRPPVPRGRAESDPWASESSSPRSATPRPRRARAAEVGGVGERRDPPAAERGERGVEEHGVHAVARVRGVERGLPVADEIHLLRLPPPRRGRAPGRR